MIVNEKKWYAVYVKSRTEKKVAVEFDFKQVDYYLPLIKRLKKWSDRKKWIEEPLFKGYIFVFASQKEYFDILQTPNVVKYITFEGNAVPIPLVQIHAIKLFLEDSEPPDINTADLMKGQEVEVISGKLTGLKGNLVEVDGKQKVKVMIETVNSSIVVSIPKNKLRIC